MGKTKGKIRRDTGENYLEKMLSQIRGSGTESTKPEKSKEKYSGELQPGEELNLKELESKGKNVEAAIDYVGEVLHAQERIVARDNKEIEAQLKEIMAEIKKLADSSKELQVRFKTVAVEQYAIKPSKYHKSFFTWLLSIIKAARAKIEDSNAWLNAMHSKKKSRGYTEMAKKGGTSFTQNMDRAVATQVG